jgi:CRISPR/Cas system-associated exonuclease Cas4 (RecB family)
MGGHVKIHKSHLEAWLECPRRFWFQFVKQEPYVPTVAMQVGTVFHEFAKCFWDWIDDRELEKKTTQSTVEEYLCSLIPDMLPILVKPLAKNFVTFEAKRYWRLRQMGMTEYWKPVERELHVETQYLEGTVDRIDRVSSDTFCVVEYKTGYVSPPAVKRELGFYVLLVEHLYPVTHVAVYNPNQNVVHTQVVTPRLIQLVKRRLQQFQRALEVGTFPKRESWRCFSCPFAIKCLEMNE